MGKYEKLILRILKAKSDNNIKFEDLRNLLLKLGFDERVKGSHHVFRKEDVVDKINIQRDGPLAKAYQVKQVRRVIVENDLSGFENQ
ncbi:MAG: type II toxin-antitoxin system HicA family toxin [Candidatus Omnitrophica bacterium]|nr:type II toxin-antitoxin system HicA family toxin [Candidatus Omnitrophota bacterium]MCA9416848.1 type II toxin-antitoxin system HicA family toxin [Candidatus Omnitrophota bacterium]MCA9425002.1 type II toxin-antitoxin system HicA family toxin [Candidatus Omnitrophota bacterium]MCA9430039.1 type II toxin-antitoxin system HicA family toxin [Candidatus Omnitrophota bacterium]MCA9444131.1 type II toxin-antitoxin system HicA family toxin [Candidatus Omnitrophota bacterium]